MNEYTIDLRMTDRARSLLKRAEAITARLAKNYVGAREIVLAWSDSLDPEDGATVRAILDRQHQGASK